MKDIKEFVRQHTKVKHPSKDTPPIILESGKCIHDGKGYAVLISRPDGSPKHEHARITSRSGQVKSAIPVAKNDIIIVTRQDIDIEHYLFKIEEMPRDHGIVQKLSLNCIATYDTEHGWQSEVPEVTSTYQNLITAAIQRANTKVVTSPSFVSTK